MTNPLQINDIPIEATFAEAFDMKTTRLIITADDAQWARNAAAAMTGFGTSVIACGIEIDVERELNESETPDGRPGVAILAFAMSGSELEKQIPRRAGQCVLTCPTTALYAGLEGDKTVFPKRIPLGKTLRYFGDGHQISKVLGSKRYWRIPVMDGEFVCEHDVGRIDGIGGGNFLLLGSSMAAATKACRAAVEAMRPLDGIITPFPGGATRSGSKRSRGPSRMGSTAEPVENRQLSLLFLPLVFMAGCVLLIASLNLANMLFARSTQRTKRSRCASPSGRVGDVLCSNCWSRVWCFPSSAGSWG